MVERSVFDRREVEQLFHAALECSPGERPELITRWTRNDPQLREAVERLLEAHAEKEGLEQALGAARSALSEAARPASPPRVVRGQRPAPARLGRYTVHERLGEGGMGVVYLAEQKSPRRLVALKVLKPEIATDTLLKRFRREADLLGRLRHPGIAQVYEAGSVVDDGDGEHHFLAMELIRGLPLEEYASAHRLDARRKLEILKRICEAVDCAHENGVVHRDLKPGNILILEGEEPKVLDFGVARSLGPAFDESTHTEHGQLIGTIRYMSPEQLSGGADRADARSDVYSLGVIAYELLSGRLPYDVEGKMVHEAAALISETPPRALTGFEPSCDADLEAVIFKALEKSPRLRYPSAGALAAELGRYLRGEPLLVRPPGPIRQLARSAGRHKTLVGALVMLVAGIIFASLFALRESALRRVAERQRSEILSLADSRRVAECVSQSRPLLLWPQTDEKLRAIDSWLERAEALSRNLAFHRQRLRDLAGASGEEAEWQRDLLSDLVGAIERLDVPATGLRAKLLRRIEIARENRVPWSRAIASIADPKECSAYGGLRIEPVDGLIPLGRDPRSGLWEFLAPHEEAAPFRDPSRDIEGPLRQGVVLVLVPGGNAVVGSPADPAKSSNAELPQHDVLLDPFFIAKHEVTFGQWREVMGTEPVPHARDELPVASVSWDECTEFCRRMGLVLPSEAQWEYAARSGAPDAGLSPPAPGAVHSAEEPVVAENRPNTVYTRDVDSLEPNLFGLYHMLGNVHEWCADYFRGQFYSDPRARRRNAVCQWPFERWEVRAVRGGGFRSAAAQCRTGRRFPLNPRYRSGDLGFRPARPLFPPPAERRLLDDLLFRIDELVDPGHRPETKVRDLGSWLERAARLEDALPRLRSAYESRRRETPPSRTGQLEDLVRELEAFLDPETGLKVRMELLCEITRKADELWEHPVRSIADPAECPAYGGLEVLPQFGFVPMRKDPESGLWIFVHFLGLEVPPRNAAGTLDTTRLVLERTSVLRFVLLPGGTFRMGGEEEEEPPEGSGPRREVTVAPFLICRYEISQTQWLDLMEENPSLRKVGGHPVTNLSGHDCLAFAGATGLSVPTAAQWEYACGAGTTTPYSTGDMLGPAQANFDARCIGNGSPRHESVVRTVPVDAFAPNAYGLYNMHGNIGEWCVASESADNYRLDAVSWVVRGGSWLSCAEDCRSWSRRRAVPGFRGTTNGFRPVRLVRRSRVPSGRAPSPTRKPAGG